MFIFGWSFPEEIDLRGSWRRNRWNLQVGDGLTCYFAVKITFEISYDVQNVAGNEVWWNVTPLQEKAKKMS